MSAASAISNEQTITLSGSTEVVTQFFEYSVNSILYQRGIYPPETFRRVSQYGLAMMVTTDEGVSGYIHSIMAQLKTWLLHGAVQKLILVIKSIESGETLERWAFDVSSPVTVDKANKAIMTKKSDSEITKEIQAIIRQITASVTFLPLLNEPCCFDLLVYADKAAQVPVTWDDSDPCLILGGERVALRSFNTTIHNIGTSVSYRLDEGI